MGRCAMHGWEEKRYLAQKLGVFHRWKPVELVVGDVEERHLLPIGLPIGLHVVEKVVVLERVVGRVVSRERRSRRLDLLHLLRGERHR